MAADVVDRNVTVSGPGSQLWLANQASHIKGNLTVHDSSGAWNGSAGTSFGDNTGYAGPDAATADGTSQVDGNFSFLNNTGGCTSEARCTWAGASPPAATPPTRRTSTAAA
jgi:hypothetical protein